MSMSFNIKLSVVTEPQQWVPFAFVGELQNFWYSSKQHKRTNASCEFFDILVRFRPNLYLNDTFQYNFPVSNFMKIHVVGGEFCIYGGTGISNIIDAFRCLCRHAYKSLHFTERIQNVYVLHRIFGINEE
jgi:hypothetical protein